VKRGLREREAPGDCKIPATELKKHVEPTKGRGPTMEVKGVYPNLRKCGRAYSWLTIAGGIARCTAVSDESGSSNLFNVKVKTKGSWWRRCARLREVNRQVQLAGGGRLAPKRKTKIYEVPEKKENIARRREPQNVQREKSTRDSEGG